MIIDLNEKFPLLSHAPIVEAVLAVSARAEMPWEESYILEQIKKDLPEYPVVQSAQEIQHKITIAPDVPSQQATQVIGWRGLRCESADKRQIVQFNRDFFSFSRLKPYRNWDSFFQEGMRLWTKYRALANPTEIQRIGLRFINKIKLPQQPIELDDYLECSPKTPKGLDVPLEGFLHHNILAIPGHPYNVNVIQTVQPAPEMEWGIILDIDVFTNEPILNIGSIEEHLVRMRWIKNKVFFGSITNKAQDKLK